MIQAEIRILQQITDLTRKWSWGPAEVQRLDELLRTLAHLDGYRSDAPIEASRYFEEVEYGLRRIASLDTSEAAALLVAIAKKHGGETIYENVSEALLTMSIPAATQGLRDLARSGGTFERRAAADALRRRGL